MTKLFCIALIIFINGCATMSSEFTSKQPAGKDLPIERTIVLIGYQHRLTGLGGTAYFVDTDKCYITVTRPESPDDHQAFCTIGHELWHCLTGDFHKDYKAYCP